MTGRLRLVARLLVAVAVATFAWHVDAIPLLLVIGGVWGAIVVARRVEVGHGPRARGVFAAAGVTVVAAGFAIHSALIERDAWTVILAPLVLWWAGITIREVRTLRHERREGTSAEADPPEGLSD